MGDGLARFLLFAFCLLTLAAGCAQPAGGVRSVEQFDVQLALAPYGSVQVREQMTVRFNDSGATSFERQVDDGGRSDGIQDVTASLYSVIRGAAFCTSLCFAAALQKSEGLARGIQLLFLVNAVRLSINYVKPLAPGLGPIVDWMFILVLAPLYGCLGVWLWRSKDKA